MTATGTGTVTKQLTTSLETVMLIGADPTMPPACMVMNAGVV
jgi:hypothetical protein